MALPSFSLVTPVTVGGAAGGSSRLMPVCGGSTGSGALVVVTRPGALACTALAAEAGVQMFRTHDVAATVLALRMSEAILAKRK